jgi:protein phosphatase
MPDLRWSGMTHVGRVRKNNEDAFLALCFDGHDVRYLGKTGEASAATTDFVFAVSDGMGGAQSGEFASRITIEKLSHWLPRSFRMGALGVSSDPTELLVEIFHSIHAELVRLGRFYEECRGMGTTLSMCWLTPDRMYFGHVGDSRIYHLPGAGGLHQLTHDHSHVGWLRRQGRINEREARSHPMRNALNQALGANQQIVDPQVGAVVYEPGDRFLLCSDGLIDGLWDHHLEEFVRTPDPAGPARNPAQRLITEALERSGKDNLTAVVVETLTAAKAQPDAPE